VIISDENVLQDILTTYRERFQRNLFLLAEKDPSLLARVENSVSEERLIKAEDGELTMRAGSLYLESSISPKKQAVRFARLFAGKSDRFLFLGCGLGYHINELLGTGKTGILIEQDIEMFRAALFVLEPAVIGRLLLVIGFPAEEAVMKIPTPALAGSAMVTHPVSGRIWPRYYEAVGNGVRRKLQQELASEATVASSQCLWIKNVLRNVGLPHKNYSLLRKECAGRFAGPVLLVASGPWLEEAMEKIARLSTDIPVFSLLPSLPYLLSCGVKPDLVLSTDPGFYNRDRARAALDAAGTMQLPLATTFSADHGMLRSWRGKVIFFSHGLAIETLLGDVTNDALSIPMQGTSALVMILLARVMGFDRIFLAGYDFAVNGIKDHHRGGGFDTIDLAKSSRFFRWDTAVVSRLAGEGFYRIGGGSGDEKKSKSGDDGVISKNAASGGISTSHKLSLYRTWFEQNIVRSDLVILTGPTGIRTGPAPQSPVSADFEITLEPYTKRLDRRVVLKGLQSITRRLSAKSSYEKRYEMLYGTRPAGENPRVREDVKGVMDLIDRIIATTGRKRPENSTELFV
jgi:hypothetical protein